MVSSRTSYRRSTAEWRSIAKRITGGWAPTPSERARLVDDFARDVDTAETATRVITMAGVMLAMDRADLRAEREAFERRQQQRAAEERDQAGGST